jgi:hypothetical protein
MKLVCALYLAAALILTFNHNSGYKTPIRHAPPFHHILNKIDEDHMTWSIAIADFDHDGNADVAVTTNDGYYPTSEEKGLDILLGDGRGNFTQTTRYSRSGGDDAKGGFYTVISDDFNEDNDPDLLILNNRAEDLTDPKPQLIVLLGEGNGEFTVLEPIELKSHVHFYIIPSERLAVGDFNEDGHKDVVVATIGEPERPIYMEVLFGNGTGMFPVSHTRNGDDFYASMHSIAVGDIYEDGHDDVLVSGASLFQGGYCVFRGDGEGGFSRKYVQTKRWGYKDTFTSMALTDLNNDGHLDAGLPAHVNKVYLMFGDGGGEFSDLILVDSLFWNINSAKRMDIAFTDLNMDEVQDLVIGNAGMAPFNGGGLVEKSGAVFVFPADWKGDYQGLKSEGIMMNLPYPGPTKEFTCYDLDCSDIDNDGDIDIVAATRNRLSVETFLNRLWNDIPEVWMEPDPSLVIGTPYTGNFTIMITDAQGWQNIQSLSVTMNGEDITAYVLEHAVWRFTHEGRTGSATLRNMTIPAGGIWEFRVEVTDEEGNSVIENFTYGD